MTVKVPMSGVLAALSAIGVSLRIQQEMQQMMMRWEIENRNGPTADELLELSNSARRELDSLKNDFLDDPQDE